MVESSALMGAILKIIHPELYKAGIQALRTLQQHPEMVNQSNELLEVLQLWSSPFSGYSVISNRETPVHRDNSAQQEWYDLLVTIGPYHSAVLMLPSIGVSLQYNSGTVVGLGGKVVSHGVEAPEGDRICIAHYMRDQVHERLQVKGPEWMQLPTTNH